MKSKFQFKRTFVHDEQVIRNVFRDQDGITLVLESKHSNDQVRLTMSDEELATLLKLLQTA